MYMLLCLHPQMFYAAPFVLPPTLFVYNHYLAYLEAGKNGKRKRERRPTVNSSAVSGTSRHSTKFGRGWFSRSKSSDQTSSSGRRRARSVDSDRTSHSTVPRRPFYSRNKSYHEYRKNLQGIQNMMGQYCEAHDAFIQWLKDVSGREMKVLMQIWAIALGLLTVFYLIPLRFIFLFGGTAIFIRGSIIGEIVTRTTFRLIQRLRS